MDTEVVVNSRVAYDRMRRNAGSWGPIVAVSPISLYYEAVSVNSRLRPDAPNLDTLLHEKLPVCEETNTHLSP
jgi:hypothetical protein